MRASISCFALFSPYGRRSIVSSRGDQEAKPASIRLEHGRRSTTVRSRPSLAAVPPIPDNPSPCPVRSLSVSTDHRSCHHVPLNRRRATWAHRVAGALTHRNFRHRLVRRAGLHDRHVDAELRAELARLRSDEVEFLSRARRLSRQLPDPALHADRRRHRRSARSPAAAHRLAVRAGVLGVHAGGARPHRPRERSGTSSRCRSSPAAARRSAARRISR